MAFIYENTYFCDGTVPLNQAKLSVAGSAVLYGLSVYTVFPVVVNERGDKLAFRLKEHYDRLINSASIIGIDTFAKNWTYEKFVEATREVVKANDLKETVFARATVHIDELVPGTKSRGLKSILSIFLYEASSILPQDGARLKTSVWRRIPDYAIPSRAKVNGAYVNSVLAKQDAIDSGYDDCIFLDSSGHVCELSAANIFIVRENQLITPGTTNDLLEGINRRTILELAEHLGIKTVERDIDLTELYIADEVFACGTSAYIAPITEIDARNINNRQVGPITKQLKDKYSNILNAQDPAFSHLFTKIG